LAAKLNKFFEKSSDQWLWPEPIRTYGNGIVPYALLRYALVAKDPAIADIGLKILKFLQNKCQSNRMLGPIGNEGWLRKQNRSVPTYSQQPIDAAYMIWAWLAASLFYRNHTFYLNSKEWMSWFDGNNVAYTAMYEKETLKAYDGINATSINRHSGAESNICLLLSLHMLKNKITL
jgi:hypothetical protein